MLNTYNTKSGLKTSRLIHKENGRFVVKGTQMEGDIDKQEWSGAHYYLLGQRPPKNDAGARIKYVTKKYMNEIKRRKSSLECFYSPSVLCRLQRIDMK